MIDFMTRFSCVCTVMNTMHVVYIYPGCARLEGVTSRWVNIYGSTYVLLNIYMIEYIWSS